jgi:hypothetical protein
MLEDMVWDDKIIVGYGDDSSDSDCDSEEDTATSTPDDVSETLTIAQETLILHQLVSDLQKMKDDAYVGPETQDSARDNDNDIEDSSISPDAVTVSHSKDAMVQITGKMLQEWITTPKSDDTVEKVDTDESSREEEDS